MWLTPPQHVTERLQMNINHTFRRRVCRLLTQRVLCNLSPGNNGLYLCEWWGWRLSLVCVRVVFECVCLIPSQDVMASLIPTVIDSPLVFSSLPLTEKEWVQSNQEVNYLELTASHEIHISQQALLMPTDCLLFLSLTISVSHSQSNALRLN